MPESRRSGILVSVSPHGPCPQSLGNAGDVSPPSIDTGQYLVPTTGPDAGLICEYRAASDGSATTALRRSFSLPVNEAIDLGAVISNVSTKVAKGTFHCPADFYGTVTIVALDYNGHTVDLWHHTSGCQTLDNGDLLASEDANTSFCRYMKAIDRTVNH